METPETLVRNKTEIKREGTVVLSNQRLIRWDGVSS